MSFLTNVVKVLEALGIKNKSFNDKRYVNTTGDTMTGGLINLTSIDPLTTLAESWIGPSSTTGVYFKGGNVGIGTTSPAHKLDVDGIVGVGYPSGNGEIRSYQDSSLYLALKNDVSAHKSGLYRSNTGKFPFYFDTSSGNSVMDAASSVYSNVFMINSVEKMRIDSSGNVGIGTTNPLTKLQINSTSAYESASLGSELLSSSNWTLGTGWTGDFATGFAHTSGTADLSNTLAAVVNNYYQIAYTVTGRTTGSFTVAFGGQSKASITATGTFGPKATATGSLVITPTSDFNGTIVVSIKQITSTYSPTFALYDSTNTSSFEIRNSLASLNNTFIGKNAGARNTTGYANSAQGSSALRSNTTGSYNSAQGVYALYNLTGGYNNNTAIGYNSGRYYNGTTGNLTSVSNSLFLGASASALANGDTNEIVIGYNAIGNGSNTIKLGNTSITNVASNGDFEALDIGDGFILKSPDGTRYRITVANGGALSAVAV